MEVFIQNRGDKQAEGVLNYINSWLVLEVVKNDLHDSACWDLSTLDHIEEHVHDLLSVQAALDLMHACLESLEGHLADNKLSVSVSTFVDQECVDLLILGLGAGKLKDHSLGFSA